MTGERIAVVQHGDWRDASHLIHAGQPETYFGMTHSVHVIESLVADSAGIVVSLNAPAYDEQHGPCRWLSVPAEAPRRKLVPGRWAEAWRAARIVHHVRSFEPTRLLLRSAGMLACRILRNLAPLRLDTLVVGANVFHPRTPSDVRRTRRLVSQLNMPHVYQVGNHRWPATQSMVDHGVLPEKAVAWDWPNSRHPRDYSPRELDLHEGATLLFVGSLLESKGVRDVVDAVQLLRRAGSQISARIVGDGPDRPWLESRAGDDPSISLLGRRSNEEVFELMRSSTLVCVPSRPEFTEGMPLTLTEALAARTPVVVSDHPVFQRSLRDGEGVVTFAAGNAQELAQAVARILESAARYAELSRSTEACFRRLHCPTTFEDLVLGWQRTWGERHPSADP